MIAESTFVITKSEKRLVLSLTNMGRTLEYPKKAQNTVKRYNSRGRQNKMSRPQLYTIFNILKEHITLEPSIP